MLSVPAWARGQSAHGSGAGGAKLIPAGFDEVSGDVIELAIGGGHRIVKGRRGPGVAVNGSVPGPLIRLTEGQKVRLNVTNNLDVDSSIHWHGLLLPFQYDGVPGVSFPGIRPGETFAYEFPIRQSGTYWYHSHSGLQEQSGHYGPMIIGPRGDEPIKVDRNYILLLSDFTTLDPHFIMNRLRTGGGYFNYRQNTLTDDYPMSAEERRMWGKMRMMPTDIADIGAPTYTFLANGRIPGLPMSVIATDGQAVRPVEVDEFQIGTAETYDVIVEPGAAAAYSIVAESMERSGMALATLASAPGARATVPALRDPPLLTMGDMGMNHGTAGPEGLIDALPPGGVALLDDAEHRALAQIVESGPIPASHGVVRWRLIDLAQWVWDEFAIRVSKQTLSRELRALGAAAEGSGDAQHRWKGCGGYRKLSARLRHHAQDDNASPTFRAIFNQME